MISEPWQLGYRLKTQRLDHDVDARMIEHFFGAAGEEILAFAEPFFSFGVACINLPQLKLDAVAGPTALPLEIAEEDVLDRLADHPRAEQTDADLTP